MKVDGIIWHSPNKTKDNVFLDEDIYYAKFSKRLTYM